ncbi:MAG: ArnT family glycosyltransferase [Polyangiales bacterium]
MTGSQQIERKRRRRAWMAPLGAAAACVAIGAGFDRYAARGVRVEWRAVRDGEPAHVTTNVEHRVAFANAHRPLSRYVQAWPFERWDIPERKPRFDARVEGWLHVPQGAPRIVRARTPNESELRIDGGAAKAQPPLPPGRHYVEARWRGDFEKADEVGFRLVWGPNEEQLEPIPRSAIVPPDGSWTALRTWVWLATAAAALLFGLGLFLAVRPLQPRRRRRRLVMVGATALLLLAVGFRAWDYPVMPEYSENPDELFAIWNGWQLLEDGGTRGWSLWPHVYGDRVDIERFRYFRERPFRIIRPYFEHPPLLHLMVGGAAHFAGSDDWRHVRLTDTRPVPILLGGLTALLVVAIGRRLWPASAAPWLAGLLYAVLPTIALQGRVIKEEALMVPLALGSLLAFLRWRDEGEQRRHLVLAAVLAGLCTLAKAPGILYVLSLAILVTSHRRLRAAAVATAIGVGVSSLLLLYGAAIDWDVFWFTTTHQATGRPTHWNLFPRFFADSLINHNLVGHGWMLFLWASFFVSVAGPGGRTRAVLAVPVVVYVAGMAWSSGNWTFGWYWMPLYPFLCLGAGKLLDDLWRRPDILRALLFVGLLLMYSLNFTMDPQWAKQAGHWPQIRTWVTILLAVALVPYALAQGFRSAPTRGLARAITAAGLVLFVGLSGWFVGRYDVIYEQYRNFDRQEYFDR